MACVAAAAAVAAYGSFCTESYVRSYEVPTVGRKYQDLNLFVQILVKSDTTTAWVSAIGMLANQTSGFEGSHGDALHAVHAAGESDFHLGKQMSEQSEALVGQICTRLPHHLAALPH